MDWTISRENAKLWDLAYALGAFMGDGFRGYSDYGNGAWFSSGIACMDKEIVDRFADQIATIFNRRYTVMPYTLKTGTTMYKCIATAREVYEAFVFSTMWKTQVPEAFVNCPKEVLREFIAGLFDTDGTINEAQALNGSKTGYNPRWQLGFGGTERRVVEDVAALLQRSDVQVGKIGEYTKAQYRTVFTIHPNLRSFVDAGFYFRCERKAERVKKYLGIASETLYTGASA